MFNRLEQFSYVLSLARYFFCFCFYNSLPQVFLGVFEHAFNIRNNKSCSTTPILAEVYYIKQKTYALRQHFIKFFDPNKHTKYASKLLTRFTYNKLQNEKHFYVFSDSILLLIVLHSLQNQPILDHRLILVFFFLLDLWKQQTMICGTAYYV